MADLTSIHVLIDSVANRSEQHIFRKSLTTTVVANQFFSWWLSTGFPALGVAPTTTASIPTNTTQGSLVKFTNPGGGNFCRLHSADVLMAADPSVPSLYDRLAHSGGLSGTDTALKTINTPAITRGDTNGVGAIGFVECYAQLGATPQTLTVSYTNTAGTAARTASVSIPAAFRVGRLLPIPLQGDDLGIKSIETVQLGGSTGTAGDYGVTIARRVANLSAGTARTKILKTGLSFGYPKIESGACLWLVSCTLGGTLGAMTGGFNIITTG